MPENQLESLRRKLINSVDQMNEQELNELIAFWKTRPAKHGQEKGDAQQEVSP